MNQKAMKTLVFVAALAAIVGVGPFVYAAEVDDKIESSFKETYVYKTYLKDEGVKAQAKDGVVTLTGTVTSEAHKVLAQEAAAGLPGVSRVDSKLTTKAQDAAESADVWMVRRVKLTLMFHRNVSANKTIVEAKDGIVTLKGEALNVAQKELTAEYAKDIDGVKEVKNEMTVATAPEKVERTDSEKIDDASITAQVKTALWNHRSTSSLKTKVETRNGEVTLTGIANNDSERSLVTKLVTDIRGVISVKNEMTVQAALTK